MSQLMYYIYYRSAFKMGEPHTLSSCSAGAKYGMDAQLFDAQQFLDQDNDNVGEEEDTKHLGLGVINVAT